ncbi:aminodeoxychorismate lyase apoprotein [Chromohalobacter marismortui]|uniref:Aminodeoxychorismate lyase n=1 Tax=Chromohalobacter marismortui TaxID=42055 RepID=A0A4R7NV58_9GAMM|nr:MULTISPECIES: aminodeoxychorismate lyase [Chromohalobacter]MCI0510370.1 aminodeoxychorismate lyase [Chromohalobacter sp.]MCI0594745.1 aminodeoxychorismate lyase [Chromohalobacter sp.]TDU25054.1 aminodeoxychorismate lyase apoprotein [Chromohalobacter marismortui]
MADEPLPFDDRGLAYGDGLFETVLVRDGHPLLWDAHLQRLARGAQRLEIPLPDTQTLASLPGQVGAGLFVLKLLVTRGSGGRGYASPASPTPRLRWRCMPFTPQSAYWRDGVRVRLCRLRLGHQPLLAGIKHLNRLENVMARREWCDADVAEGVLCDQYDRLVETTSMNLVWQRHGALETPDLTACGVAGTLLAALRQRLPIRTREVGVEALMEADAAWVVNSVQGVWPLRQLDDAEGACLRRWTMQDAQRYLQRHAHPVLGYPHDVFDEA